MPIAKETPYQAFEFDSTEFSLAVVYTDLQYKHIQTELAAAATARVVLAPDYLSSDKDMATLKYLMEQEFLRGKMQAFTDLLNTSDDEKTSLLNREQDNYPSQPDPNVLIQGD